jgi:uncharacterized protein (TIGR02246 family)
MSIAEDEQAIRNLAARYSDAINRADGVAAASVYAPDGVLEMDDGVKVRGTAKLVRVMRSLVEDRRECLFQMTHSSVVTVTGDTAVARFWFSEVKKPVGEGWECTFGVYQDRAVRLDVGWRFSHRMPSGLIRWTPTSDQLAFFPRPDFLDLGDLATPASAPTA